MRVAGGVALPAVRWIAVADLEAMYCGTPVIAAASGGPLETVVDGETGFLREVGVVVMTCDVSY